MQRVKARPRETSLLSEEDSFIEDVVEDSPTPDTEGQPLLTEVFRARDQDEMVTMATRDRSRDQEMVTIVNPSIRESKLEREGVEVGAGVNTSDHPVSLVYANNENQYAVDITTPTPEEVIEEDPIKEDVEENKEEVVENKESVMEVKEEVEMVELETIAEKAGTERVEDAEKVESVTPESAGIAETSLNESNIDTQFDETVSVEKAEESEATLSQHSEGTEKPGLPEEIPVISATPEETVSEEMQDAPVQEEKEKEVEYEESEEIPHHDEKDDEEQPIYSDPEHPVENGGEQNIYHPEPTARSNAYQPVPVESDESEERSKTPEPQIDEYGNLLDENGHPIMKHAFPDDWVLQPDEEDGIMRFETGSGDQVRFIMNLTEGGFNYPNPPNQMRLEMDTYHKHIPITHRIASGCEFFVDTGEWRLQLESDIVNLLLRMDVASDFEDVTGEVFWNQNKDITIENLTRAMTIFKDCILDDSPVRWMLTMDSVYNPKSATFRLVSETHVENVTKGVSIHDGMSFVDSKVTVSIPDQSDTEVRNVRNFIINKDSVLEEQGIRHLDSVGCHVEDSVNDFLFNKDVKLEDQGTRHLLNEDAKIEDQGTRHLLCEEGDMEDVVTDHVIHQDIGLDDIVRGYDMCEDSDRLDIKRHYLTLDQSINRTPAIWNNSHFEGELVDLKSNNMVMDMKFEVSPSKFKLNQLDIDDDMLADIEDE